MSSESSEANQDLVNHLRFLTERAEKGQIKSLAWAGVSSGGYQFSDWRGDMNDAAALCSSVTMLRARYTSFMLEDYNRTVPKASS